MDINDLFETFVVTFEIEHNGSKSVQTIQGPRLMIQQQILDLAQQAARAPGHIRVKVSREFPIYDNFKGEWIKLENSITFSK